MIALMLASCLDAAEPLTLYELCLREASAECACGADTCPDDAREACRELDPAACAMGDPSACETQAALAPMLDEWACWVVHYEATCDAIGADCEGT